MSLGATMALYEERSEHGEYSEQVPQKWYSRFARERINLSASVEAELIDKTSQEAEWQDDDESSDGYDGKSGQQAETAHDQHSAAAYTAGYSKALIPPRLSLQSRVLPALYPGGFVEAAASVRSQPSVPEADAQKEAQPSPVPQNTGILTRLAQRLTSSLAAFGGAMHPEMVVQSEATDRHEKQDLFGSEHAAQPLAHIDTAETLVPPPITSEQKSIPLVRVIQEAEENTTERVQAAERRQRLGRTTRVRLQTASQMQRQASEQEHRQVTHLAETPRQEIPVHMHLQDELINTAPIFPSPDPGLVHEQEALEHLRSMVLRAQQDKEGTTSAHLPAVDAVDRSNVDDVQQTRPFQYPQTVQYPQTDQKSREMASPLATLYDEGHDMTANPKSSLDYILGNGAFESGQQEVTVLDQNVMEGCIVQIMLLNDPGPVVVHYVSVQPHIGFTAHLTAPAAMRTAFNYIIFRNGHL